MYGRGATAAPAERRRATSYRQCIDFISCGWYSHGASGLSGARLRFGVQRAVLTLSAFLLLAGAFGKQVRERGFEFYGVGS